MGANEFRVVFVCQKDKAFFRIKLLDFGLHTVVQTTFVAKDDIKGARLKRMATAFGSGAQGPFDQFCVVDMVIKVDVAQARLDRALWDTDKGLVDHAPFKLDGLGAGIGDACADKFRPVCHGAILEIKQSKGGQCAGNHYVVAVTQSIKTIAEMTLQARIPGLNRDGVALAGGNGARKYQDGPRPMPDSYLADFPYPD